MNLDIDDKDIAILSELRQNSRISMRKIAEQVGMHPNTVFQRIARLERIKIIKGYRADIDFERLGYSFCAVVMLKAADQYLSMGEDIWSKFDFPEIEAFYRLAGDNDCCMVIRAKTLEDFNRILNGILSKGMVRTTSNVVLEIEKPPFSYNPLLKPKEYVYKQPSSK